MAKALFIDLTEKELSVYASRNGSGGMERISTVPVGERFSFSLDNLPPDTEAWLSLPLSFIDLRVMELPFSDENKIRELLPFELDNVVLGGSGNTVFDIRLLETSDGKAKVLVAYVNKGILGEILGRLKAAGADPRVITSVELVHLVGSAPAGTDIASALLSPTRMSEDERLSAAGRENTAPTFNFRRGDLAYTADSERTKKSLRLTAMLGFVLAVLIAADAGMMIFAARRDISSLKAEARKTYLSLFPEEKKISNELYQLKAHIKELKDKETVFSGVSPLQVLLQIAKSRRPGVTFTEISVDREATVLKGECQSAGEAQKLTSDLETALPGVTLTETKPSAQGKTLFTIIARGKRS